VRRHLLATLALSLSLAPAANASTTTETIPLPAGAAAPSWAIPYPKSADVLLSDWSTNRIWRLPSTPFAGTGALGSPLAANGDGGAATAADLDSPAGLAFLRDGGLLVADTEHHKIRLIKEGVISTVAGTGNDAFGGDGGAATAAALSHPFSVAVLPDGKSFLIADTGNHRIRHVDGVTGVITTLAGSGADAEVDGALLAASFSAPQSIEIESDGKHVLVLDRVGRTVRRVHLNSAAKVETVAGPASGDTTPANPRDYDPPQGTFAHDGDDAETAGFSPMGIELLADDSFIVFDAGNDRVRRVKSGVVETIVGTGSRGNGADGLAATATDLFAPSQGFVDEQGRLVFIDAGNSKLRRVIGLQLPSAVNDPKPKVEPLPPVAEPRSEPLVELPLAPVPAPVMGKTVGVAPGKGVVRIRRAGSRSFVTLAAGASLPVGSIVDTRKGSVTLSSSAGAGKVQAAAFSAGMFEVRQQKGSAITDLHLRGPLAGCPKRGGHLTARAAARKRPARRLWGDGKGRFRTHGSSAVATVRGTKWLTEDTCKGTLVKVARGIVDVTAVRGGKTVKVKAGHQRFVVR
jgi:DNA-binding beta-propeller fold protein YncE